MESRDRGLAANSFIVSKPTDKKSLTFVRRNMWWEAPSMPTAAYDPHLLPEQDTPLMIGKTWFLDQEIPVGGFVRIQDSYEPRMGTASGRNENRHDGRSNKYMPGHSESEKSPARVPGLPIRDCTRGCKNRAKMCAQLSATGVTAKTFFERLYLVLGLR